jgi:hypothetical protein
MKKTIFHYHLFKNAGTSLDASFKENFNGDEWVTNEFPAQPAKNRELVKQWISENPQALCFSSHTAFFPPAAIEGNKLLPVIFVRHPIDRIASAYSFEKKQGGNGFGSVLARNTDIKGYCECRLALGYDRQCKNFHVDRFADMYPPAFGSELERALKALDVLPFVGLVEEFAVSLQKLETWLKSEGFEDISIAPKEQNVSRDNKASLDEKLAKLEVEMGADMYAHLLEVNADDMALYEAVKARYKE